jgi:transposase
MANPLLAGEGLWDVLEPLLPERPARRIGRPRVEDRVAFTAILFVLVTGLPWRFVPAEIGDRRRERRSSGRPSRGGSVVGSFDERLQHSFASALVAASAAQECVVVLGDDADDGRPSNRCHGRPRRIGRIARRLDDVRF